jgi:hypothetical protein
VRRRRRRRQFGKFLPERSGRKKAKEVKKMESRRGRYSD